MSFRLQPAAPDGAASPAKPKAVKYRASALRFGVGQRVECHMGPLGYLPGTVVKAPGADNELLRAAE